MGINCPRCGQSTFEYAFCSACEFDLTRTTELLSLFELDLSSINKSFAKLKRDEKLVRNLANQQLAKQDAKAASFFRLLSQLDLMSRATWYGLGLQYESGNGVKQDYAEALKCYAVAADLGLPEAFDKMGNYSETGHGCTPDYGKAKQYYETAFDLGHSEALFHVEHVNQVILQGGK